MAYGFVPIVHIVAAVFAIVELGLTAYGKLPTALCASPYTYSVWQANMVLH
jgi:hypothetical protein